MEHVGLPRHSRRITHHESEKPSPLSVASEKYQEMYHFPNIAEYEKYSFGEAYESTICELVHFYLELGTDDKLCYVGDAIGNLADLFSLKFCLLDPVTTVFPGHIHYEESPRHKMHPVQIAHVGAEEYFKDKARTVNGGKRPFNKILLHDCGKYLQEPKATFANITKCLDEFGKLLIIMRPSDLNTLPIPEIAKSRLVELDHPYMKTVKDLQSCGMDVSWEIEILPIIMPKVKWLSMLKNRFPACMEIMSNNEISSGIRELSEGVLKYEGEMVEFQDRLLFITASPPILDSEEPLVKRFGTMTQGPGTGYLGYRMEVTKDIKKLVPIQKIYTTKNQGPVRNQILF